MSEPFLGEIRLVAFGFAPKGWARCAGQLLAINQNQALFSLLGTNYGGDGRTTFALPDLRGRAAVGQGDGGPSLTDRSVGERGGVEAVRLLKAQLPVHRHAVRVTTRPSSAPSPAGAIPAAGGAYDDAPEAPFMNGKTVANAGGASPHPNMQPYLALTYIIALQGIFPSPN